MRRDGTVEKVWGVPARGGFPVHREQSHRVNSALFLDDLLLVSKVPRLAMSVPVSALPCSAPNGRIFAERTFVRRECVAVARATHAHQGYADLALLPVSDESMSYIIAQPFAATRRWLRSGNDSRLWRA
jgi:hypothetical protein